MFGEQTGAFFCCFANVITKFKKNRAVSDGYVGLFGFLCLLPDVEKRDNPVCHFVTPLDGSIGLDIHRPAEVKCSCTDAFSLPNT